MAMPPTLLISLLAAHTPGELLLSGTAAAARLLGITEVLASAFALREAPDSPFVWTWWLETALPRRAGRMQRGGADLLRWLETASRARLIPWRKGDLLDPLYPTAMNIETSPLALMLPLKLEIARGAWIIGLANGRAEPPPDDIRALEHIAAAASQTLSGLLELELQKQKTEHLRRLHEMLIKAFQAGDPPALLSEWVNVLDREFGLPRVMIALVREDAQVLASEMHKGFDPTFAPLRLPLDQAGDPLIRALRSGRCQLIQPCRGECAPLLAHLSSGAVAERCVLLPLVAGGRPLGLIYADQVHHHGLPIFMEGLEAFAQWAAGMLDNLWQRVETQRHAETDALTGLYNRHYLDRLLQIEIPRVKRYNHPISLLMIDLCDFKRTNDIYGHVFGDFVLRETGRMIQANVRRPDVVVRFGGDEFVVLMVNTGYEQARLVQERIEQAFIERNQLQSDERMRVNISLGLRSANASNIETLLHEADRAMYVHKGRQARRSLIEALVAGSLERIELADRVVGSLCNILFKKAPYYPEHARRVAHLALKVARRIGLEREEVEQLALAALLHDVGKVSIPTEVLRKREPLTPGEIQGLRHHPVLGEEFFQGIEHLEPIRPLIRSHHERWDGRMAEPFPAYPAGIRGEAVPLGARILRLAESVDGMLSERPWRAAHSPSEVETILRAEAGKSFDPRLVEVLLGDRQWPARLGEPRALMELLDFEQ